MRRRTWGLFIFAAACSGRERPLDLLVVDVDAGTIVERWEAPRRSFDVKIDESTGRVWLVAEEPKPALWEVGALTTPRLVLELPTGNWPFGDTYVDGLWFDRGAIDIDEARRRIAFTSPRSDRTVLMNVDTETSIAEYVTQTGLHAVHIDDAAGAVYAVGDFELFSFDSTDGSAIDETLCPHTEPLFDYTTSVAVAESAQLLFGVTGDAFLCTVALSGTSRAPTFRQLTCGVLPCSSSSIAVDTSARTLFIANTAADAAFPEDPAERIPSITFWDLQADVQDTVQDRALPHALALSSDGATLVVADYYCNRLGVYDVATRTRLYDIETDGRPWGMDFAPDGRLFVTQFERNASRRTGDYGPSGSQPCP